MTSQTWTRDLTGRRDVLLDGACRGHDGDSSQSDRRRSRCSWPLQSGPNICNLRDTGATNHRRGPGHLEARKKKTIKPPLTQRAEQKVSRASTPTPRFSSNRRRADYWTTSFSCRDALRQWMLWRTDCHTVGLTARPAVNQIPRGVGSTLGQTV